MATLYKYRIDLGWSSRKLALEAGVSHPVARRAENGEPIQAETAKAIADALSRAYGKEIKPSEIEGLKVL